MVNFLLNPLFLRLELRAEITEISLTDRNQFLIQWEVSKVCGPGIFLSISDSEGKEIEKVKRS